LLNLPVTSLYPAFFYFKGDKVTGDRVMVWEREAQTVKPGDTLPDIIAQRDIKD
jgi:hypothetical protein